MTGSWSIVIPSQGIRVHGNAEKIIDFLNGEIAYYGRLALTGVSITFANQTYGSVRLTEYATREISRIISDVENGKTDSLEQYIQDANSLQILVGQSPIGKRVELLKQESLSSAAVLASIFSPNWSEINNKGAQEIISMFRAIAFAAPSNFGFDNLLDASQAVAQSKEARETSGHAAKRLEDFIAEKTKIISDLENLYRQKLTIQEPAVSWKNIAAKKTSVWRFWLSLFAALIAAPIIAALLYWEPVALAVGKITGTPNGGFSISGLAVISVPALFYAWLLKNISRVFIQNLNLADDADHRRSLALTYMGLLQDDKRPATDQDRAIILNALFRPIPPHTGDEGPPAGLLELIKK